jgi:hypothetical protein
VVMAGLTALADRCDPQDPRTMDQRRADALVGVFRDVLADPDLPKRQGERARIAATGGILTLLGLRNDPGELVGYGPITASTSARSLLTATGSASRPRRIPES